MTYCKSIPFPGGTPITVTDFDPVAVLGQYTVSSPDEVQEHCERIVVVTCANCDKTDEGTAAELEAKFWWLGHKTVCSIECLFALADAITEEVDKGNLPF